MDGERFDRVTRALTTEVRRRQALAWLLGGVFALFGRPGAEANHVVACRDVGARCSGNAQCCSGRCRKKRGANAGSCRAHHVGTCQPGQDFCATGGQPSDCGSDGAGGVCQCFTTTGGAPFCGNPSEEYCPAGFEAGCRRDPDCGIPGAACVDGGDLCGGPTNETLGSCDPGAEFYCVTPCPTAP